MPAATRRLRILTWNVHASYLWYLSHIPHEIFVPVRDGRPPGYAGRPAGYAWPRTVHEVPADEIADLGLDCLLFQSRRNWSEDQHAILSPAQRRLPKIVLEHSPPSERPGEARHYLDDPDTLLIHVSHFNHLMWDSGRTPTRVIEHGVRIRDGVRWTGKLDWGLVVAHNLPQGGRRLGADLLASVRQHVPIDLVGAGSEELGGLGQVPHDELLNFAAQYRFLFSPARYVGLSLAVCEAMAMGMPVIGLATSELATVVENGVSGWVDTDLDRLVHRMSLLLDDPEEARRLGQGARRRASVRFGIERFVRDWDAAFRSVTRRRSGAKRS